MSLIIHMARSLIETTDLRELSFFLFYLEVYFVYRAVRLLLKILIELLFSSESLDLATNMSLKAEISARRLSRLFFTQYILLHLIEDAVRRALVYGIFSAFIFLISAALLLYEIKNWQNEIIQSFENRFPVIWKKIQGSIESRLKFVYLPFLFILVLGHDIFHLISSQLIKFDFFKRLLSEVFKKKLEQSDTVPQEKQKAGETYLSVFDYYLPAKKEFYIDRDPMVAKQTLKNVNSWLKEESLENLVILVGNRGIGKTTSVKMIFDKIESENKLFCWVSPKICTAETFYNWLSLLLKTKIESIQDFVSYEKSLEGKKILVVDDIHNFFIGKIGGFRAYEAFMEILGLETSKIFWCLTVNSHAWTYLLGIFGKEHFYGNVYTMRMWTDAEIQNLILARHNCTGFTRSFDRSITAYGTGNVLGEQAETQFFRLLWGQSRGNPRSAMMYWISAISQPTDNQVHVGVPKFINSSVVGTMSTQSLIVLSAISRHDSMTLEELVTVTGIERLVLRKCLKESLDKGLVWSDSEKRIRISSRAQNAIDYYLIGKNFLYE
jgi:hypothetical protein